jgi:hypothetical protein
MPKIATRLVLGAVASPAAVFSPSFRPSGLATTPGPHQLNSMRFACYAVLAPANELAVTFCNMTGERWASSSQASKTGMCTTGSAVLTSFPISSGRLSKSNRQLDYYTV